MANIVQQYLRESDNAALMTLTDDGSLAVLGAISSSGGSNLGALLAKKTITAAQLKALKATPQSLIAAPGAGKMILVLGVGFHYNFLTSAFTLNAGTLKVYLGPVANAKPLTIDVSTGMIDQANNIAWEVPVLSTGALTDAQGVNVDVELGNAGAAEFTVGLGSLEVFVAYSVVTL